MGKAAWNNIPGAQDNRMKSAAKTRGKQPDTPLAALISVISYKKIYRRQYTCKNVCKQRAKPKRLF